MRMLCLRAVVLMAALVCVASASHATVETVTVSPETPETMGDWSIETNQGAIAELAAYGPAVYERTDPWIADDEPLTNLGEGAFYVQLHGGGYGETPPSAWLGLDKFKGQSLAGKTLSQITKMEYFAYVGHIPGQGKPSWDSWTWWKYPRQPIMLQITAEHPTTGVRRQFWFMPSISNGGEPIRGDNSGRHCKKWIKYDAMDSGNTDPAGAFIGGSWYSPPYPSATNENDEQWSSWTNLVAACGSYKLVATSTNSYPTGYMSAGWDVDPGGTNPPGSPTCTATGKCINFEWGAREEIAPRLYFLTDVPGDPDNRGYTWTNDYVYGKGYVDRFTLGISGTEVLYDFEPSEDAEPPTIVAINTKAAYDSVVHNPSVQKGFLTKIVGKATRITNCQFQIDDGSGNVVQGFLYSGTTDLENPVTTDEIWSVWGYLDKPPFVENNGGPWLIWTSVDHMEMHYSPW
jgi:hypothetical protein